MVLPGASVGELSGNSFSRNLDDFVWGTIIYPQISKRASDLLVNEGVTLITAEALIRCRGRLLNSHLAVQAEPAVLLTDASLKAHKITNRPICGEYKSPKPLDRPDMPEGYEIKHSQWPKDQHLVLIAETLDVLASPEFIEAVQKHGLKGIAFVEYGRYV
jgi:hypothetical protein